MKKSRFPSYATYYEFEDGYRLTTVGKLDKLEMHWKTAQHGKVVYSERQQLD